MANFNPADSGYVEVKDRIEAFYKKYPEGSIQSEIVMLNDNLVVMKAFAYRFLEDTRPGVGHSQLAIPGTTGFTKGSELENAETSAVGRAIAALGFEVHRSVASAEEVRMHSGEQQAARPAAATNVSTDGRVATLDEASQAQKNLLRAEAAKAGLTDAERKAILVSTTGKHSFKGLLKSEVDPMVTAIASAAEAKRLVPDGQVVG